MNPFVESVKEGMRVVVLAIIPIAIIGLTSNTLDMRLILMTAAVAGLRFIDAWLHETGAAKGGLTQF